MGQLKIVTFHQFVEQLNKKFNQEPKEKKTDAPLKKTTRTKFKASKILNKNCV